MVSVSTVRALQVPSDLMPPEQPARVRQAKINELVLVDLKVRGKTLAPEQELALSKLFRAESCARHLYVGTLDQIENIDPAHRKSSRAVRQGAEAYSYLLRIYCGLESSNIGEYHIKGQLKDRWRKFNASGEKLDVSISKVMNQLFEDSSLIRTECMQSLDSKPTLTRSAKQMAEVRRGDNVLLVCLEESQAINMLRELGKSSSSPAGTMGLVTPDDRLRVNILRICEKGRADKEIVSKVLSVSQVKALNELSNWSHIFVAGAANTVEGRFFSERWQNLGDSAPKLVFLRPDKTEFPAAQYNGRRPVTHADVMEQSFYDRLAFKDSLNTARTACRNCAASRLAGVRPVDWAIKLSPVEYAIALELKLADAEKSLEIARKKMSAVA